jgi:hypothetical protein
MPSDGSQQLSTSHGAEVLQKNVTDIFPMGISRSVATSIIERHNLERRLIRVIELSSGKIALVGSGEYAERSKELGQIGRTHVAKVNPIEIIIMNHEPDYQCCSDSISHRYLPGLLSLHFEDDLLSKINFAPECEADWGDDAFEFEVSKVN